MPFRVSSRRLRRTIFSIVLLALALAQTLGVVHRVAHSPLTVHARSSLGAQPAGVTSARADQPGAHWLQALFSGHDNERGCHLFDQLSHSDLMQVEVTVVACLHPDESPRVARPGWHFAAQASGFLARGPPLAS